MNKKIAVILGCVIIVSTLLAACAKANATQTPEPCSSSQINDSIKPVLDAMHAFDDTTFAGNITPQQSLIIPILDMQKTRRDFETLSIPSCLDTLHKDGIEYMNSVIQYMGLFMAGGNQDAVTNAINTSQSLRILYEQEKARLLGQTFVIPPTRTPGPTATATAGVPITEATATTSGSALAATGVTITNSGVETVNLRSAPAVTGSDIVDQLAAGATAPVLAKNDYGDWLLISYNGNQVWVFGALVTINGDLATVPVFGTK